MLWFLYDNDGTRVGLTYNETPYYYMTNAQGDVTSIVDENDNIVVQYSYDAWGKLLSTTGSMASTIGKQDPFLYRGYYYDSETGLYYLNSGYYDAQAGRSLNADDTSVLQATQGEIMGLNLFAYCNNNPVMCSDPTGCFSVPTWTVATAIDLAMTIANITVQGTFTATSLTFRGLLKWGWSKQLAIKLIKAAVPKIKGFMKACNGILNL